MQTRCQETTGSARKIFLWNFARSRWVVDGAASGAVCARSACLPKRLQNTRNISYPSLVDIDLHPAIEISNSRVACIGERIADCGRGLRTPLVHNALDFSVRLEARRHDVSVGNSLEKKPQKGRVLQGSTHTRATVESQHVNV